LIAASGALGAKWWKEDTMSNLPRFPSGESERRSDCWSADQDLRLWPTRPNPALAWLANATCGERHLDNIFFELCRKLQAQNVPITRASVFLQIDHPQWCALQVLWRHGMNEPKLVLSCFGERSADLFYERSHAAISAGDRTFRVRLEEIPESDDERKLRQCLRREFLTDYIACPLPFTLGKCNLVYFATDRPCGFCDDDLLSLSELIPVLSSVLEVRMKNRLAHDLLDTYVGPQASEAILAGATKRGDCMTVEAAVIVVDLRGFTTICEQWPRDDVIAMLNDYFDAISEPIERYGGEILKFMGDGLLAVFPSDAPAAGRAVADMCKAMASLNAIREGRGRGALDFGVGVNYGDVTYGNIGSRKRLDFTVIGSAVNVAARLEALTKLLGRNALFSGAFAAKAGDGAELQYLGDFCLRGISRPIAVFGFAASVGLSSSLSPLIEPR
jgi:adenylate cyclase